MLLREFERVDDLGVQGTVAERASGRVLIHENGSLAEGTIAFAHLRWLGSFVGHGVVALGGSGLFPYRRTTQRP